MIDMKDCVFIRITGGRFYDPEYRIIRLSYWGRTEKEALEEYMATLPEEDSFSIYRLEVVDSIPEDKRLAMIQNFESSIRALESQIKFCKMKGGETV
jgi:hypothetical protein